MERTIKEIEGLKCFSANHIYGTMLTIKLGYPEVYFSDDGKEMDVDGEWGITVEAAKWAVTINETTMATSDSQLIERKAAINDLIAHTINRVNFDNKTSEITVTFSNNIKLNVYPNFQETHTSKEVALWSLKTPDSIVSFYKEGKHQVEIGKLTKLVILR